MSVPGQMLLVILVEMLRNVVCPCKTPSRHQCSSMPGALTNDILNLCTSDANCSLAHEAQGGDTAK